MSQVIKRWVYGEALGGLAISTAHAGVRVGLVIGNAANMGKTPLENRVSHAKLLATN